MGSNNKCRSKSGPLYNGGKLRCHGDEGHAGRHFYPQSMTKTLTWEATGDTPASQRVNSDPNSTAATTAPPGAASGGVVYPMKDIYAITRGASATYSSFKDLFNVSWADNIGVATSEPVSAKDSAVVSEANKRAAEAEKAAEDVKSAHNKDVRTLIGERDRVSKALEDLVRGLGTHRPVLDMDPDTGETECEECWGVWPCTTSILIEEATHAWDR